MFYVLKNEIQKGWSSFTYDFKEDKRFPSLSKDDSARLLYLKRFEQIFANNKETNMFKKLYPPRQQRQLVPFFFNTGAFVYK